LAGRPIDEGTGGDCELYKTYYRIALKTLHAHPDLLVATKLWDWAIDQVQSDLKKQPELEASARKKASQFTHEHYRPFTEFSELPDAANESLCEDITPPVAKDALES